MLLCAFIVASYAMGVLAVFLLSEPLLSPGWWALSLHPGSTKTQALCFSRSWILPLMGRGELIGGGKPCHCCKVFGLYLCGWGDGLGTSVARGTGPRTHCYCCPVTYICRHRYSAALCGQSPVCYLPCLMLLGSLKLWALLLRSEG